MTVDDITRAFCFARKTVARPFAHAKRVVRARLAKLNFIPACSVDRMT